MKKIKSLIVRVNNFGGYKKWLVSCQHTPCKMGESDYCPTKKFNSKKSAVDHAVAIANEAYFDNGIPSAKVFLIDYKGNPDGMGNWIYDASSQDD